MAERIDRSRGEISEELASKYSHVARSSGNFERTKILNDPIEQGLDSGVLMDVNTRLLSVVVTYHSSRYANRTDGSLLTVNTSPRYLTCM